MTDEFLTPALTAASPNRALNAVFLAIGVLSAALFVAYLLRCYCQEFRRNRRLRRRRESSPPAAAAVTPCPLTFAPPKRKPPGYHVAPTIQYTVTACSATELTSDHPEPRAHILIHESF